MQPFLQGLICILLFGRILGDCQSSCVSIGYTSAQVIGTGPFCNGNCNECGGGAFCLSNQWSEGNGCITGSKACCCRGLTTTAPPSTTATLPPTTKTVPPGEGSCNCKARQLILSRGCINLCHPEIN